MTPSKTAAFGVMVLALAACENSQQRRPAWPGGAAAPPTAPPAERAANNPVLNLPIAAQGAPLPTDAFPLFVTASTLLIGSPPAAVLQLPDAEERGKFGFGKANKDSEYSGYVLPLGKALAERTCDASGRVPPVAVIYMDADMQYRVFIDLLYSLTMLGYKQLYLATRATTAAPPNQTTTGIRIRPRTTASHRVEVKANGLSLFEQDSGSPIGPSCAVVTQEPGKSPPVLSLAQARACADQLVGPTGTLHLVTPADMPLQAIVPALVELGEQRALTPTFPLPARVPSDAQPDAKAPTSVTISNAAKVVASLQPAFTACFQQDLATDPSRTGRVRLTIRVGAAGDVTEVTAVPEGNLDTTVDCVKSEATRAKFAPPEGGSAVVAVPVTFAQLARELTGPKPPCTAVRR